MKEKLLTEQERAGVRAHMNAAFAAGKITASERDAVLGALSGEPHMDPQAIETINANLKSVRGDIEKFSKQTNDRYTEVSSRLLHVEQAVANIEPGSYAPGGFAGPSPGAMVLAEINEGNSAFDHLAGGNVGSATFKLQTSIKAALTQDGSSGYPSDPQRTGIQGEVLRPLTLLEALPSRPTARDAVEYVQLGSEGDAAEQEQEGDEKAETHFEGVLKRAEIATVALHTTASRQVLADHTALQGEIDRVLRGKCRKRLEQLVVNGGTGSDGNSKISGLMENSAVFVPVVGGLPADLIGEAVSAMRSNGYSPDVIVMHPRDWHAIAITKTTQDEDYLLGKPTAPIPPSLWGLPVVQTPAIEQGTVLVVDRSFVTVLDREQAGVQMSNSHGTNFTKNLVTLLGELRAGLEVRDVFAVYRVELEASSG